jgi:hypothetical protein
MGKMLSMMIRRNHAGVKHNEAWEFAGYKTTSVGELDCGRAPVCDVRTSVRTSAEAGSIETHAEGGEAIRWTARSL